MFGSKRAIVGPRRSSSNARSRGAGDGVRTGRRGRRGGEGRRSMRVEILVVVPPGAVEEGRRRSCARRAEREAGAAAADVRGLHARGPEVGPAAGHAVLQRVEQRGSRAAGPRSRTPTATGAASPARPTGSSGRHHHALPVAGQGCRGPQRYDGFNDVGWARLSGGTLGVTWYSTIDRRGRHGDQYALHVDDRLRAARTAYDLETVFLHENGHVAGLGHSTDTSAVMYPSYRGVRCALAPDDRNGLATLY